MGTPSVSSTGVDEIKTTTTLSVLSIFPVINVYCINGWVFFYCLNSLMMLEIRSLQQSVFLVIVEKLGRYRLVF